MIAWSRRTQDLSSTLTASSTFDFEADGRSEVIYADECFARIYDGSTGDVLLSHYRSSCTWSESAVVADVDGDYRAELVIPSNKACSAVYPTRRRSPTRSRAAIALPRRAGCSCRSPPRCARCDRTEEGESPIGSRSRGHGARPRARVAPSLRGGLDGTRACGSQARCGRAAGRCSPTSCYGGFTFS